MTQSPSSNISFPRKQSVGEIISYGFQCWGVSGSADGTTRLQKITLWCWRVIVPCWLRSILASRRCPVVSPPWVRSSFSHYVYLRQHWLHCGGDTRQGTWYSHQYVEIRCQSCRSQSIMQLPPRCHLWCLLLFGLDGCDCWLRPLLLLGWWCMVSPGDWCNGLSRQLWALLSSTWCQRSCYRWIWWSLMHCRVSGRSFMPWPGWVSV